MSQYPLSLSRQGFNELGMMFKIHNMPQYAMFYIFK